MLKDITLGQYFPGNTLAHRLDPRAKLMMVIIYIVALFCAKSFLSYGILALDQENYSWALVCGPNRSYLWILARRPVLDEAVLRRLTAEARAAGFETEKLIFVQHDAP